MILKGKSHPHAGNLGSYLLREGKNELVRFWGTEGTLSQDLKGALREMGALAQLTNCDNYLYHLTINPQHGTELTPEQWARAIEIAEKAQHLEGHQRAIVEHVKNGTTHLHVVWNRIDPETLTAQRMSWDYVQHEEAARQMEKEFGLEHVQGVHVLEKGEKPAERGPTQGEVKQAKESGLDLYAWRQEIREIEKSAGSGASLVAALEEKGNIVAHGDKVAFMLIDPAGNEHRMAQSLGLKVKDLRGRMEGLAPQQFPTVEEAKELSAARAAKLQEAERERGAEELTPAQEVTQRRIKAEGEKPPRGLDVDCDQRTEAPPDRQKEVAPVSEKTASEAQQAKPILQQSKSAAREVVAPDQPIRGGFKGAAAGVGLVADVAEKAIGGFADFFAGGATAPAKQAPEKETEAIPDKCPPSKEQEARPSGKERSLEEELFTTCFGKKHRDLWKEQEREEERERER